MAKGETELHKELKALSLVWAEEAGYTCRGVEIRLENCSYRADVAAYKPAYRIKQVEFEAKTLRQRQPVIGTTAVFECKQARSDLLNDSCITAKTRAKLSVSMSVDRSSSDCSRYICLLQPTGIPCFRNFNPTVSSQQITEAIKSY